MSLLARVISFAAGFAILIIVSYLVRRRKIYNIYAITWLGLSVLFILLGAFAGITNFIAHILGINFTPIAILVIVIGCIFAIILHLSIIVSEQHQELKRLEKEIALMKVIPQDGSKNENLVF